jgi:hypothetical protein
VNHRLAPPAVCKIGERDVNVATKDWNCYKLMLAFGRNPKGIECLD